MGIMTKVKYFKATMDTHRFRQNQKVWIRHQGGNSIDIYFRWRGKGRYTNGIIYNSHKSIGEIKEIEVQDSFALKVLGDYWFNIDKKKDSFDIPSGITFLFD